MSKNRFVTFILYAALLIMNVVGPVARIPVGQAQSTSQSAGAVVLINSASPAYTDFQHYIQPYLDHFGVPYALLDIAAGSVTTDIGGYALIIIGHRQLDLAGTALDSSEQGIIAAAVNTGTGLVNFDNDLSVGDAPRYTYINSVFGFGYITPPDLSGVTFTPTTHYITQNHAAASTISTSSMVLAGLVLQGPAVSLANAGTGSEPFLAATTYGQGRAVQWGTYAWMSHSVKGPAYDLDDLVWRSLVWAARKPFVMQGMPPFVTFRMDDTNGPLDWIHIANEYGFIPWAGLFPDEIDSTVAAEISGLAAQGKATFGMHAFTSNNFFYFNHAQATNFSDAVVAQNFTQATQWFHNYNIPISKYTVGHYYELGTNVFGGLQNWGVQFVTTMMGPGQAEANAQWVNNGPFRLYETDSARDLLRPVYYADYLNIPGHPELANRFFNCATEYRDIDGYEWHPSPDIAYSVSTGKHWLTRAFNNMQVATLFTHEYDLDDTNMTMWRQIMQGISQEIAGNHPIYVSLDYACQYARATHNSTITAATYNAETKQLVASLEGSTDLTTKFYVFSDAAGQVQQYLVDVPAFTGSTQTTFFLPGPLHHISILPDSATVITGGTQQFSATGYDSANNPIPNLFFTWQVVNGGGSINTNGLFTAGANTGTYANTVVAAYGTFQASATVQVTAPALDHFSFDAISTPVYAGTAFPVTLRALDAGGNPVSSYVGTVTLSDTTGTLQPNQVNGFTNGVWTGPMTISQVASGVTIQAADGGVSAVSGAFDVVQIADIPYSIWPDSAAPANPNVSDGIPIEPGVKFRSSVNGYITGLRFYKGSGNTGTHTGSVWAANGTQLAQLTFTNETASGWQQASFSSPVAIVAGTTYVASYFSPTGYFSDNPEGLATAVVNGPIKALANGEDGPNGVYNYGSSGFPTATWAGHSPNYWVDVVFQITLGPDTTAPTVVSFSPISGATGVGTGANVSVVFNESLNAGTVSTSTVELRDPANTLVPAAVSYDSATRAANLDPTALLANATTYTVVVIGGPSGIQDLAGNPLAADATSTFTTEIQVADGSYTIWDNSATPSIVNVSDGIPIEPGVKFRSNVDGYITGLRFYKGSSNIGTHAGHLWTSTGTLLSTATFTGETDSGWQQVALDTPVPITTNTTYVASYFSPTGYFSETADYFTTAIVGPALRALANGEDGPNGVYNYGSSGFPTATWVGHSPNYWVDVVFQTTIGPDTTPPAVTAFSPSDGATGVSTASNVSVVFSEALNSGTVSMNTVELRDPANTLVPAAVSYDSASRTGVLDPTELLANETLYTVVVKGGPSGIQDVAGNPMAADVTSTFTTQPVAAPLDHFGFDAISTPVFAGTAFPVTLRALDASGSPVVGYAGTVTLSDTTGTLQPAQASGFTNGVWTGSMTISQVANGVTIGAVDGGASGVSGAFDVVQIADVPYSIWPDSVTPAILNVSDGIPIELGVKFRSDVDGYITGLRFYKGSSNTGTHTGQLWSVNGASLAQLTFTNESESGWQQASFSAPVAVTAGITYVASYFSPTGYFSETADYFTTSIVSPPLRALANGLDGSNGVYNYGSSGFPTATWVGHAPNYWMDVVFKLNPGPDTTPPVVASFAPASGATGVSTGANVSVVFNEALNAATVSAATVELRDPVNALVPAAVSYDSAARAAVLDPTPVLANTTTYTVVVKGGPGGIQDVAGNPLPADTSSTFTSEAPPPPSPNEGPGGPILIIYSAGNPFSRYYAEILRAEGLNAFLPMDITQVTAADLLNYDVILLGEMALTTDQATLLVNWVTAGGNLIAMRPDVKLNSLMGLSSPSGTFSDGYLLADTSRAPGKGITNQTIQYHGPADLRTLNGATNVAALYQDATTATASPAVSVNSAGVSGGQAAAFAYDLARSIVFTRQGNPAWAGQERDGNDVIRSDDLFFGNAAFDPKLDWVNLNKVAIPQADEQQRLLANLILYMNGDRKPLPRFWYLPNGEKAAVLMTGDNHFGTGTAPRFDYFIAQSPVGCSVDDWECIRGTAYVFPNDPLSNTAAAGYQSQGFEVALHVTTNCANFTFQTLTAFYNSQLTSFQTTYPSISTPTTERTHCIVWSDWDSQVRVKLDHHIRMDLDYYFWPATWIENRPGFFTGSGMPMRYTDINGNMLDVYQTVTQMTDESGQTYPYTIDTLLDRALGAEGYYGIFTANMHNDYESGGAQAIVTSAKSRGVPVVSAEQVRKWLDGRNNSSFQNISWNGSILSFQVGFGQGSRGLQVLLPRQSGTHELTGITLNGSPVTYTLQTIKGIEYAAFLASAGTYQAQYGQVASYLPIVVNDSASTQEDTTLIVQSPGVLANDTDPNGKPLTAVLVSSPAHGGLTLNADGSYSYAPVLNYSGSDSFNYRASNGSQISDPATVSLTVIPVNDPPMAADNSYTTAEDTPLAVAATGVLGNDTDIDSPILTAILMTSPAHGAVIFNSDGSFLYTPAANYNGPDSFTYQAFDGLLNSNTATVSLTVTPVNDPPVAGSDAYITVEDTVLNVSAPGVLANDTDGDSPTLTAVTITGPAHGTLTLNSNGSFRYTPAADYNGADSFTYQARDGLLNSNNATVNLTITPVNDPPMAANDAYTILENGALTIAAPGVLGNDTDVDSAALTVTLASDPTDGIVTINPDGSFTYAPAANYYGADSFTYVANDGQVNSNLATVTINILSDTIFADGFESGNLSSWTSNTSGVSATMAARLVGNYGMQVSITGNSGFYVTDNTPNAEKKYRVGFYFDPNTIPMSNVNRFNLFTGYAGTSTSVILVEFQYQSRAYQFRAGAINNSSTWVYTSWYTITDAPHYVELNWQAATAAGANNGVLTLWIDGTQKQSITTIANNTRMIDRVRLGAVSGVDTGTRGTVYFDYFESHREAYIGP